MLRPSTASLVRQLVMYSRANPDASDSAEGIARWWLDPHAPVDMQALDEALQYLVARSAFAERQATDGRRRFVRIGCDALLDRLLAKPFPGGDP